MSKRLILLLCIMLLKCTSTYADCKFLSGSDTLAVSFNLPPSLSIPRDLPVGSVIYESPIISLDNQKSEYSCDYAFDTGVVSAAGETGKINTFRIGSTGVAFQWLAGSPLQTLGGVPDILLPAGIYKVASIHQLRLVKIGPINNGAQISGPGGVLGTWKVNRALIPMKLTITTGMVIQTLSCETPDVKVTMGHEVLSAISTVGGTATVTSFQIPLKNCPDGIEGVTYSLSPVATSPALDTSRGIIRLNPQSTAKGAAIQITDDAGAPVVFNKAYPFKGYSSSGGNFNIPLSAKYVRSPVDTGNSSELKPGTANAEIAFIIEYL